MAGSDPAHRPEHWRLDAHGDDLAQLDIPAHASRERTFEIFCTFSATRSENARAHLGLRVLIDGAQQWARRVSISDGTSDSLDVRLRRTVPVGAPLRIAAVGSVEDALPWRLSISADED